ncbi:uncharacterized protein LOC114846356 [Betta splendens]|uniref:Uncharacterized protein LOC114846356 n=1 Tax=Betta splendens TaxID=158456 RepID=A0A9W2XMF7_BETSP|nr:uncharacterized protein LOC114846356 [Betta splendens]
MQLRLYSCYSKMHCTSAEPYRLDDLTTMGPWPVCLVLLLPLTMCSDREATIVQRAVGEHFVTPLCSNATKQNDKIEVVVLVTCSIRRLSSREDCRLLYRHEKGFEHGCGSRFRLKAENHTILLHLTSLTAEDSGNYSCECSRLSGTIRLQFNVTVEENEDLSTDDNFEVQQTLVIILVITSVCCVAVFIIITGLFLRCCFRRSSQRLTVLPNTELEEPEPYDTFIQRENELYSDVVMTQMYI